MRTVDTTLDQIVVADTPARRPWDRVKRLIPAKLKEPIDLDALDLSILPGEKYTYVASDGNHRLARIQQMNGPNARVRFVLLEEFPRKSEMDEMVEKARGNGISSWDAFLAMCLRAEFLREDSV